MRRGTAGRERPGNCAAAGAAAPQGQPGPGRAGGGGGGGRGGVAPALFTAVDTNKDGSVTRAELKGTFDKWFTSWDTTRSGSLTQDQLAAGLTAAMPRLLPPPLSRHPTAEAAAATRAHLRRGRPGDDGGAARRRRRPSRSRPRKILVLGATQGFVHSSIPLAAKTIEAMGEKTKAWTARPSRYDAADINDREPQTVRRRSSSPARRAASSTMRTTRPRPRRVARR